jgi:hypothetical protein
MSKGQIAQSFLLDPLNDGMSLVRRYQEGQGFRGYVKERMALLVPVGLLMAVTSIGLAAGTVLFLGGTRSALVLLAILLVPFVLAGSFFVQAYMFASWLENRALAKALHHSPRDIGAMPPVPWVLAAIFLVVPLAMLFSVVPQLAAALIALQILAPFAFARLDR